MKFLTGIIERWRFRREMSRAIASLVSLADGDFDGAESIKAKVRLAGDRVQPYIKKRRLAEFEKTLALLDEL